MHALLGTSGECHKVYEFRRGPQVLFMVLRGGPQDSGTQEKGQSVLGLRRKVRRSIRGSEMAHEIKTLRGEPQGLFRVLGEGHRIQGLRGRVKWS